MPTHISKWRFAYELWSQYGAANVTYRAMYEYLRRSRWFKRRFPATGWDSRPLATFCSSGVPAVPAEYVAFRRESKARFFFASGQPPVMPAEWSEEAIAKGDAVLAGRPPQIGHRPVDLGFPFDGLIEPRTGRRIEARDHWSDLDHFAPGDDDLRLLWETGRFGWAFWLGRAYAATRSPRYAEGFWTLLESWRAANPPNLGPHWLDGQECSLRLMAMCFGLYAFSGDPASTPARIALLAQMVALHAERIEGNLGFARTQLGNHAVSEAAALYTAGVLFPEFIRAPVWRRKGLSALDDQARRHNWRDGSYVQHSMNYHRLILQDYLWVMRLADLNGDRLAPRTVRSMDGAFRFLYLVQDPLSGKVPNYGPNDGSLILPLNGCDFADYRPAVSAMSFQIQGRTLYDHGPWDEDLLWLFGSAAQSAPRDPRPRMCVGLDQGGYYVLRGSETWGMVRCHTFRNRPNQADLLHLDLWWRGLNILRDSGSYLYNAPEPWRDWFTSTAAHNTVQIEGQDQMVKVQRFTWAYLARSRVRAFSCSSEDALDGFEGEHYGYQRLPGRVTHRRAVTRIGETHWLVVDDILGAGRPTIRLFWQMIDAPFAAGSRHVLLDTSEGPVAIAVLPLTGGAKLRVAKGEVGDRPMGWESMRYGERVPAPAACLEILGEPLPQRIVSLVALGQDAVPEIERTDGRLRWSDRRGVPYDVTLAPPGEDAAPIVREVRIGERRMVLGVASARGVPLSTHAQFDLEILRLEHAEEVAALHLMCMKGYFLSALGERFLRRFYREFCRHPYNFGIVARDTASRRLAAFVVGTSDRAAHFRSFYRRNAFVVAGSVLAGVVLKPAVRRGLGQHLLQAWTSVRSLSGGSRSGGAGVKAPLRPPHVCPARLLSIAVAPEFQGSGVARLVAVRFEDLLRQAGLARVGLSVHADNARAIAFYRKTSWEETFRSEAGVWFEKAI